MKNRTLVLFALLGMLFFPSDLVKASDYTQEQILKELESLKNKVKAQQQHIERLEALIGERLKQTTEEKKPEKPLAETTGKIVLANTFIDQLKIKGDLRVRYERRDRDNSSDDARDRFRHRFRLGGIWKNAAENWEVGAGIATGDITGTSTNDTWGEESVFESGDIRLDYAYAAHKMNDVTVTLGQQKNPLLTSWLMWDGDVRPTGLTAQYAHTAGLFVTLGGYGIRFYDGDTAMLYAGQAGYRHRIWNADVTLATCYQHYDGVFSSLEAPNPSYDFRIGDILAEVSFPVGIFKLTPYAQIWNNFGADGGIGEGQLGENLDPEDEDTGWLVGMNAKAGKYALEYAYAEVGADSIYGGLKESDFGTGINDTDIKGHKLKGSYSITKNISTDIIFYFFEANELSNKPEVDLYQIDVKYNF